MIKSYIANIDIRLDNLTKCIGNIQQYKESEIKDAKEGIAEVVTKMHKDVQRKFERIKKAVEKYSDLIDGIPSQDKVNLVGSQMEELQNVATNLDSIQKMLPALKTDNYLKYKDLYKNSMLLESCSVLEQTAIPQIVKVKECDESSLYEARNQHRESMNDILELNGQIMKNLAIKIKIMKEKKLRQ